MEREAYYRRFGWKKSPFIKSTSIDIPIVSRKNEFNEVSECIGGWDRIMVVTAPIGYGKTTFMNQLVKEKPPKTKYVVAFNAYEPVEEVMQRIKSSLPIHKRIYSKTDRTSFGEMLQKKIGKNKMLLIFDEAQDYDNELFKWLRILNDRCNNLFMIFLGLPDLEDKITSEASFRDRKSKSIRLNPIILEDLDTLVRKRIKWVGGKGIKPFTDEGLKRLCSSCNQVPRLLLENGQKVIETGAKEGAEELEGNFVEKTLGQSTETYDEQDAEIEAVFDDSDASKVVNASSYNFMDDLSPTQQDIVKLLQEHDALSISELSQQLNKDIRSLGSLIRKLRGLNRMEVARKPMVPYPIIIRRGKEIRMGRIQYVYTLSDNARRMLAKK